MDPHKKLAAPFLLLTSIVTATAVEAQGAVQVDAIQRQLLQFHQPAKATADGADLVTAGSVLVLQKDDLLMDSVDQPVPSINIYQKGAFISAASVFKGIKVLSILTKNLPGAGQVVTVSDSIASKAGADATREFVADEKFFVTKIDTHTGRRPVQWRRLTLRCQAAPLRM